MQVNRKNGFLEKRLVIASILLYDLTMILLACRPTVPVSGQIAFSGFHDSQADIYTINLDGSECQRVTSLPGYELYPAWSPDGSKIAFSYNDNGNWSLYIANADGTGLTQLFQSNGTLAEAPDWSPDGKQIAFAGDRKICTIDSDGHNYTCRDDIQVLGTSPVWSPDGRQLAFTALHEGPNDVMVAYVMDITGSSLRSLTTNEISNSVGSWSPDGSRILLFQARTKSSEPWGLYTMRIDGSDRQFIFERGVGGASWSPDGQWLVLNAPTDETEKYSAIYIIKADGTDLTPIQTGFDYATAPTWRP
jgi:Tol biopolymer transport system component